VRCAQPWPVLAPRPYSTYAMKDTFVAAGNEERVSGRSLLD